MKIFIILLVFVLSFAALPASANWCDCQICYIFSWGDIYEESCALAQMNELGASECTVLSMPNGAGLCREGGYFCMCIDIVY